MAKTRKPARKLKVVKSTPKMNKYAKVIRSAAPWPGRGTSHGGAKSPEVNEPAGTYGRATPHKRSPKAPKRKGYDAKKYTGMIPGIAERMKEYLKTVRDDR